METRRAVGQCHWGSNRNGGTWGSGVGTGNPPGEIHPQGGVGCSRGPIDPVEHLWCARPSRREDGVEEAC